MQHGRFQPLVGNRSLWPDQGIEHQTIYQGCKGHRQCFRIDGRDLASVYTFLDDVPQRGQDLLPVDPVQQKGLLGLRAKESRPAP